MPPKPDLPLGLIILPAVLPKGQEVPALTEFNLSTEQLDRIGKIFKFGEFAIGHSLHICEKTYDFLYAGEKKGVSGALGIAYKENPGVTKAPGEVLALDEKTKIADCDEITRTAFLLANNSGLKNIVMVEMSWIDPKTKKLDGHAALVLIPENPQETTRVFDFTYLYRGEPLESENVEAGLRKKYAEDAKMPGFEIRQLKNIEEVEASYYGHVGEFYYQRDQWKLAAEAYERAAKLVPSDFDYNKNAALASKKAGGYQKALEYYTVASGMEKGENNPEILGNIGEIYVAMKKYDEAIGVLEQAIKLPSEGLQEKAIRYNLASAYVEKGKLAEGVGDMTGALGFFQNAAIYEPTNKEVMEKVKTLERKLKK